MHQPADPPASASRAHPSSAPATRLWGRRLVLVRLGWGAGTALALGFFAASLPTYWGQLATLCSGPACAYGQLPLQTAQALQRVQVSLAAYATLTLVATCAAACVWFALAGVLFWRKSSDWMALLTALFLVVAGTESVVPTLAAGHSLWHWAAQGAGAVFFVLFALVAALFPDGRFVPRWTKWLVLAFSLLILVGAAVTPNPLALPLWLSVVLALLLTGFYGSFALAQYYRYRVVATPVQRQQTKWIVFGAILALVVSVGGVIPSLIFPQSLALVAYRPVQNLVLLLFPVTLAIALLRYRLWDIDTLMNLALVYGTLTTLLAALYAGLILGLEHLASVLTGKATQPAVVLMTSTLAIATLFQPLRTRLQSLIDRRFYRRKYDAAQTLAAFSASLRNEMDLEQVRAQLLTVVEETMQPQQISLWLRRPPVRDSSVEAHRSLAAPATGQTRGTASRHSTLPPPQLPS
jgi:hypothetical protein